MSVLDELGLREADLYSLARELPERPPGLREADGLYRADHRAVYEERRRDRMAFARGRAAALVEGVDAGESIGEVAERIGVSVQLADLAHSYAAANLELPLDVSERLARPHEGEARAEMVEALGGEEEFETLLEELAVGVREGGR